jgi:AAA domain
LKRELTAAPDLETLAAWDAEDTVPAAVLPPLVSATELYQGQIVTLRPLFEDLLWDGLTMLIARPKAGKSWLTLQCAIHIAGGRELDGMTAVDHGPVLYGAFEEPKSRTMARLRKLAPEGDWTENLHFVYELLPLMGSGIADRSRMAPSVNPSAR